jgi:hypothetical protein
LHTPTSTALVNSTEQLTALPTECHTEHLNVPWYFVILSFLFILYSFIVTTLFIIYIYKNHQKIKKKKILDISDIEKRERPAVPNLYSPPPVINDDYTLPEETLL